MFHLSYYETFEKHLLILIDTINHQLSLCFKHWFAGTGSVLRVLSPASLEHAEATETKYFSIAVERTAMEKLSAVYAAGTMKGANALFRGADTCTLLPEGLSFFAFRPLSEKQKNKRYDLCGGGINIFVNSASSVRDIKNHFRMKITEDL